MRSLRIEKEENKNRIKVKNKMKETNINSKYNTKSKLFGKIPKHGILKNHLIEKFNNTISIMKAKKNASSIQNINRNNLEVKKDTNINDRNSIDANHLNNFLNENVAII